MNNEFPKEEKFLDFEGKERIFDYLIYELATGYGYSIRAKERKDNGYEFQAISESNLFNALGELRQKIRKRLSTRYLQEEHGHFHFYHLEAKGHISSGGAVIDGKFIAFDQLSLILQTYEGFLFELKIQDLSEE
jgi:hypothetical protein